MSMLSSQTKELRELADATHRRSREIGFDYGMGRGLADASRILREAADTIESLRDRLQEFQGVGGESNYQRLFGTPERAARTLRKFSPLACSYCALDSTCGDDQGKDCLLCDYGALVEWLRGDA